MKTLLRWTALVGVVVWLGGCGYRPEGQAAPTAGRPTLAVELLLNQTGRAFVENEVSNQVVQRFARGAGYQLVETAAAATLQLGGTVSAYTTTPAAYDRADRIRLYRAAMKVQVTVSRVEDGRVVWRGEVVETTEFTASDDRALQQANENAAVAKLAERIADQLYAAISAGF